MPQLDLGVIAAIIGAIFLGSYVAFVKISKLNPNQFLFLQLVFAAVATLAITFYIKEPFNYSLRDMAYPAAAGIFFAIALSLVFFSIKTIGIGKSGAIYIGLQLVVATLTGFIFFNELSPLSYIQKIETVIGIILVLAGVILISIAKL